MTSVDKWSPFVELQSSNSGSDNVHSFIAHLQLWVIQDCAGYDWRPDMQLPTNLIGAVRAGYKNTDGFFWQLYISPSCCELPSLTICFNLIEDYSLFSIKLSDGVLLDNSWQTSCPFFTAVKEDAQSAQMFSLCFINQFFPKQSVNEKDITFLSLFPLKCLQK